MDKTRLGFAMCGSFCTFADVIPQMERLRSLGYDITPIMSDTAYSTDSRFGDAAGFRDEIEQICGKKIIHTIPDAEPIGPKGLLDLLMIAPCTGNTLAKLAYGITDGPVPMAAKAHLRNDRPVLLGIATNDALSGSAVSIGHLLGRKNIFFVPFGQDDPMKKSTSCIAEFSLLPEAAEAALQKRQLQPLLV